MVSEVSSHGYLAPCAEHHEGKDCMVEDVPHLIADK